MCEQCKNCNSNKGNAFLTGTLIGAAVGAILGVLYAPKSGKQLREAIKSIADDFKEKSTETYEEVREKAEPVINELKEKSAPILQDLEIRAKPYVQKLKERAVPYKERYDEAVNELGTELKKEKDKIKKKFFNGTDQL